MEENFDFKKLVSDLEEATLMDAMEKMAENDPHGAFLFLLGRMVGKMDVLKAMRVVYDHENKELKSFVDMVKEIQNGESNEDIG